MEKKVLLTRKLHDFALNDLKKHYNIEVHHGKIPMPKNTLLRKIRDKDGLICFPYDNIDRDVLSAAKKLKTISTYSVGYDHIDVKCARKQNISIGYTPEVLTDATADLTFALILDLLRKITEGDRTIRKGRWTEIYGAYDNVGSEISGKTLGVLGLGRIGTAVAKRARAFGMRIIYHKRHKLSKNTEKFLGVKYVTCNQLFEKSDILSIHVPYTKETHDLVNMKLLKKMKKTSFIVNTARGKIVNEDDLIRALKKKMIAGAALDVFRKEPISLSNPLIKMQNVVLSPHIGSSTAETRKKMAEITVMNLKLGIAGKKLLYSVNN